jgi:hypothetical protein
LIGKSTVNRKLGSNAGIMRQGSHALPMEWENVMKSIHYMILTPRPTVGFAGNSRVPVLACESGLRCAEPHRIMPIQAG